VESTLRSLRDDFWLRDDFGSVNVNGTRVAMTHVQADELELPRMLEAKKKSSNYPEFVQRHGRTDCYELEAVEPDVLQEWLDEAIRGVIDVEAYNLEVEQKKKDAVEIQAHRKAVLKMLRR
jgi:hypothetical protein